MHFKILWQSLFHGQSTNIQTFYGPQYSPKETDSFKPLCSSKEVRLSAVPCLALGAVKKQDKEEENLGRLI